MTYAILDGDRVANIIVASAEFAAQIGAIPSVADGTHAQIGGRYIGGIFLPPVPEPEAVPQVVTTAQGTAALIQAGRWDAVLAYVDGIADPTEQALARVALERTTEWRRDSPFLNAAAVAIGLTSAQLDELFRAAADIAL